MCYTSRPLYNNHSQPFGREIHFFLLPPCAVVATTVAFLKEKGNFSSPPHGFNIYLKFSITSLILERRRCIRAVARFC